MQDVTLLYSDKASTQVHPRYTERLKTTLVLCCFFTTGRIEKEVRGDAEFCLAAFVYAMRVQDLSEYLRRRASASLGDCLQ